MIEAKDSKYLCDDHDIACVVRCVGVELRLYEIAEPTVCQGYTTLQELIKSSRQTNYL